MPDRSWLHRDIIARYLGAMAIVGAIRALAIIWCYMDQNRIAEGPLVIALGRSHGVHLFDLVVLAIELVLVALLSTVLLAGFARRR